MEREERHFLCRRLLFVAFWSHLDRQGLAAWGLFSGGSSSRGLCAPDVTGTMWLQGSKNASPCCFEYTKIVNIQYWVPGPRLSTLCEGAHLIFVALDGIADLANLLPLTILCQDGYCKHHLEWSAVSLCPISGFSRESELSVLKWGWVRHPSPCDCCPRTPAAKEAVSQWMLPSTSDTSDSDWWMNTISAVSKSSPAEFIPWHAERTHSHAHSCGIPSLLFCISLSHLPTSASWDHLLHKWLSLRYLSQGQLLGESSLKHVVRTALLPFV